MNCHCLHLIQEPYLCMTTNVATSYYLTCLFICLFFWFIYCVSTCELAVLLSFLFFPLSLTYKRVENTNEELCKKWAAFRLPQTFPKVSSSSSIFSFYYFILSLNYWPLLPLVCYKHDPTCRLFFSPFHKNIQPSRPQVFFESSTLNPSYVSSATRHGAV